MIYHEDAPALERELHKKLLRMQMNKVNPKKEFFRTPLSDIKRVIENMGISAKWTMAAEAKQFRESLAIEEAILKDKSLAAEWEKHQLELDSVTIEPSEELQGALSQ